MDHISCQGSNNMTSDIKKLLWGHENTWRSNIQDDPMDIESQRLEFKNSFRDAFIFYYLIYIYMLYIMYIKIYAKNFGNSTEYPRAYIAGPALGGDGRTGGHSFVRAA